MGLGFRQRKMKPTMMNLLHLLTLAKKILGQIARELESLNPTKEPLKLSLLNGKWRLVYTTSESVLRKQVPLLLKGGFYDDFSGNSAFDEWIMNWYHHLEGKVIESLSLMCLQWECL
jgi:hypothetical protein